MYTDLRIFFQIFNGTMVQDKISKSNWLGNVKLLSSPDIELLWDTDTHACLENTWDYFFSDSVWFDQVSLKVKL